MTSTHSPAAERARTRKARLVWAAAVTVYGVAVLHRSSLGVAGVEAVERFGVGATVLSTFVVVQLAVYAALQVPVGVLLDRFGSRTLISVGALLMATGQLLLGVVSDLPLAYLARVLIGAGDAATFICVIRLVATWFPARRVPVFTQLTGIIGHLGQLAAAVPLVWVLNLAGWTPAFVGLAAAGLLAALLAWTCVRDAPLAVGHRRGVAAARPLRETARTPGTWLGFWTHSLSQFPVSVFVLLWGFPFLTLGQQLTPARASGLLSLAALSAVASGPVIGVLTGRHPKRRSWMVLAIAGATAAVWTAVLLRPEPSPYWLLALLVLVLGVGGPGSAIGFDYARTFNPPGRLGTATGLVNVGGFATSVLTVLAIGIVLDAVGSEAASLSLGAFRVAFAVMAVPWTAGVVGVLVSRHRTRRAMLSEGVAVPPIR